ncbi:SUMF1/EgtB/PvdO family nonheme iron enzyme [Flammeovirga pacifica]|uniref:Sulfatase-modifying factor enzyme-like domain-containing protein n=1 Tax=Flammeovirga pacifica TaxID=915059 RepID=A0A1S1Z1Z4_FLAPC|nr:SUMF1/EgtB/PvdO family nonheme iron enzyme [Flammeovirga pacifica]OHX67290.1 hypothetical protein NH26_13535 [Flammeovirga pacifica]
MSKSYYKIIILFFIVSFSTKANNISINSLEFGDKDIDNKTIEININITWDNSWKINSGPGNWDAAWVFFKYKTKDGEWSHVKLNYDANDHGHLSDNAKIDVSNDDLSGNAHGAFVYSKNNINQKSVSYDISFLWNYGENNLADDQFCSLRGFAFEMVYVPEGSYHLGSGGTEPGHFYKYNGSNTTDTYLVSSENEITIGNQMNQLYYDTTNVNYQGDQEGTLSADFPKGYKAFYCMKYEITQAQFAAFLSTINFDDASNLIRKKEKGRNLIVRTDSVVYSDKPYVPIQFLSWQGLAAFLDWSALRPITELEYEKACRGTATPVANEYVWGNTSLNEDDYTTENKNTKSESISGNYSMTTGNANFKKRNGGNYTPYRTGKFSSYYTGSSLTRIQVGATFYGIMEMSGNVSEKVVTIGHSKGRVFSGIHGDGHLCTKEGLADVENWPCNDTALGSGVRGGSYNRNKNLLQISNRKLASRNYYQEYRQLGGRGCRTAPVQ